MDKDKDKDKVSSCINRHEHQVTAIGFDNVVPLAQVLDVPVSYLLAYDAALADSTLALAHGAANRRDALASLTPSLVKEPTRLSKLTKLLQLPKWEQPKALKALVEEGQGAPRR